MPDGALLDRFLTLAAPFLPFDGMNEKGLAIALLEQYNIYFSGGIECHYLIADASGRSVIAEYFDQQLCVVEAEAAYQIASNFIAYNGLNIGEGFTEFARYDKVHAAIERSKGTLEAEQAREKFLHTEKRITG